MDECFLPSFLSTFAAAGGGQEEEEKERRNILPLPLSVEAPPSMDHGSVVLLASDH